VNESLTKSVTRLNECLAPARAEFECRLRFAIHQQVAFIADKLAKANWDLEVAYPYPSSNSPRSMYFPVLEARRWATRWVTHRKCARSPWEPNFVDLRSEAEVKERIDRLAREQAAKEFDSYVRKLAGKIGGLVINASVSGSLWEHSLLTVETPEGRQVWKTQCIMNCSVLGKLFHQWPTRRVN
jgi:hypothetical protein